MEALSAVMGGGDATLDNAWSTEMASFRKFLGLGVGGDSVQEEIDPVAC